MRIIKCPRCGQDVEINIAKCVDENGEVHMCPECGMKFRYVEE